MKVPRLQPKDPDNAVHRVIAELINAEADGIFESQWKIYRLDPKTLRKLRRAGSPLNWLEYSRQKKSRGT